MKKIVGILCVFYFGVSFAMSHVQHKQSEPLKVIFETDMGNDVDDALALDMLYKYADLGEIDLLGISINKDNKYSALFLDIMNTWYGHPLVPIGIVKNGACSEGDANNFFNPDVKYRPLRVLHWNLTNELIDKLAEYGYGGLVTNVPYNNYLKSKGNWEKFRKVVQYSIEQKGLRIWLYDEAGYPSGTAGGLVLDKHPELEAQGLAVLTEDENEQGIVRIDHPKGHGEVVMAQAYKTITGKIDIEQSIDLMRFVKKNGNLIWKAPKGEWRIYFFVQKPFYESTHATHNWTEKRRYINIMEKKATDYFIEITHQQYYKHVGEYFGKGIEAFFTDEPSLLGTYFTGYEPPGNPPVQDYPDPDFKLFPTLNWRNNFLSEFSQRRGYDLYPYLPYLVTGENDKARQTRIDYYKTISELVAESYFDPLKDFCTQTKVASSGHLLLEENLYFHPIFEGDIMQMYKRMHYPGIDLLTAFPQKAKEWGVTVAKLASSVANFYGKKHVMSEISNAFDEDEAGIEGMIASVGVQFAFGVDLFNSYYRHDEMTEEENRQFTNYIGRVGALLSQGKRVPQVAFYYPIESIWENTFPSMTLNPDGFNHQAVLISDNFHRFAKSLVDNHIDFDYMGTDEILKCKVQSDKMVTDSGGKFEMLIIPYATYIPSHLQDKIRQMSKSGVKVVFQDKPWSVQNIKNRANKIRDNLSYYEQVKIVDNIEEAIGFVKKAVPAKAVIEKGNHEIIMLHKRSPDKDLYFFVNTDEERKFDVIFTSSGSEVKIWDPHSGKVCPVKTKKQKSTIKTNLVLEKWQTAIVSIE